MDALENRWIRARILAKFERGKFKIFTDVGPDELKKLKARYLKIEVDDWGRYEHPRNEADAEEKKRMKEILKG
jgi:hypothetical protein